MMRELWRKTVKALFGNPILKSPANREDRFISNPTISDDQRSKFQRDRDRILYCAAIKRLAGVTQVASPTEGDVIHNRLTHTLKVAQISRRLAEKFIAESPHEVEKWGGLDPEVVEAAALAHDLGHPPFGHIAEKTLNECCNHPDGYEGNPQSFRIVTKLSYSRPQYPGLNLTRATLNAILKYPWPRGKEGKKKHKFGAYQSEIKEFEFARALGPINQTKTLEAELMDWADDIAYSVHDMEDFFEAGLIPLQLIRSDKDERTKFLDNTQKRWEDENREEANNFDDYRLAFQNIVGIFPVEDISTKNQRDILRPMTSALVSDYIEAITISNRDSKKDKTVIIRKDRKQEVAILKELTWNYVILSPELATQQHGYQQIIKTLFEIYSTSITKENFKILPKWFYFDTEQDFQNESIAHRIAADLVSSFTDTQAHKIYQRLTGISPGSITDWV